jgi:hypothetical protein
MTCNKCQSCKVEPRVRQGEPIKIGDKVYYRHIFTCADPQSAHYNEDIMQVDTNIFDNSEVIENEI